MGDQLKNKFGSFNTHAGFSQNINKRFMSSHAQNNSEPQKVSSGEYKTNEQLSEATVIDFYCKFSLIRDLHVESNSTLITLTIPQEVLRVSDKLQTWIDMTRYLTSKFGIQVWSILIQPSTATISFNRKISI